MILNQSPAAFLAGPRLQPATLRLPSHPLNQLGHRGLLNDTP